MTSETFPQQHHGRSSDHADKKPLTADQVAAYLKENPDFFINRDSLLAEITLPHESGKAISLLERQVRVLRERSIESRITLNTLLENARYNDQLFNVTRALIIALLMEDEVAQIASATEANLSTQPGIDACSVIMFQGDHLRNVEHMRLESAEFLQPSFPTLLRDRRTMCRAIDRRQPSCSRTTAAAASARQPCARSAARECSACSPSATRPKTISTRTWTPCSSTSSAKCLSRSSFARSTECRYGITIDSLPGRAAD